MIYKLVGSIHLRDIIIYHLTDLNFIKGFEYFQVLINNRSEIFLISSDSLIKFKLYISNDLKAYKSIQMHQIFL